MVVQEIGKLRVAGEREREGGKGDSSGGKGGRIEEKGKAGKGQTLLGGEVGGAALTQRDRPRGEVGDRS